MNQPQASTGATPPRNRPENTGETHTLFSFGDRVVHAAKPEWGTGIVSKAQNLIKDGKQHQSLTIRFERAGLKTLSTAFADLRPASASDGHPAETAPDTDAPAAPTSGGWLDEAASIPPEKAMARLPEACSDPFSTPEQRLKATLNQYRFTPEGGSLLDWAATQTGLADPLSRFARPELEQFFKRYADNRDAHLRAVADEIRRQDPAALDRLAAKAPPKARAVLSSRHSRR